MNSIAFVIAPADYGVGPGDGVEPVVDGISIVDVFKHADTGRDYPEIGPFRFDRRECETALANPQRRAAPVRGPEDI